MLLMNLRIKLHNSLVIKVKVKVNLLAPLLQYLTLKALRYGSHSFTSKDRTCLYLDRKHSPDGASPD